MENFVIAKAIGFVLAGILIAMFSSRQAVFWGGTLVVSAFIAYRDPIWGVVTFVELAVGWLLGRWLLDRSRSIKHHLGGIWGRASVDTPTPRPVPPSPSPRPAPSPPQPVTRTAAPSQTPSRQGPGFWQIAFFVTALPVGLATIAFLSSRPGASASVEQPAAPLLEESLGSRPEVVTDFAPVDAQPEVPEPVPTLDERASSFSYAGRVVVRTDTLQTGEVLFVTSPVDGERKLHRLFVIDCAADAYSKNAESLEIEYLFDVMGMLAQGEPFNTVSFDHIDADPEASELFKIACP